jgi:hypothetical protein|mmetsp:Transcript_8540/g.31278  ORF Transcript_8540/g.31278 Transcript_8540/m.31278 type:complete len:115 (-) Transcript_8540:4516-4860(-)|eukprot:29350-Pelagococcus_subviridis.AAC.12
MIRSCTSTSTFAPFISQSPGYVFPTLLQLSFDVLLSHVQDLTPEQMDALPEDVQMNLFEGVLFQGKLNVQILQLFVVASRATELLGEKINSLKLEALPLLLQNIGNEWPGRKLA